MAAYDLTTYRPGRIMPGNLLFVHMASRDVEIGEGFGHVDTSPDYEVTGEVKVDGNPLEGASFLIRANGTVSVSLPKGYVLNRGSKMTIEANQDAVGSSYGGEAKGVAVAFEGSIPEKDFSNYDMYGYCPGRLLPDQSVLKVLLPRSCDVLQTTAGMETSPTQDVILDVVVNGETVGWINVDPKGNATKDYGSAVLGLQKGDLFEVKTRSGYEDDLEDLSIIMHGRP